MKFKETVGKAKAGIASVAKKVNKKAVVAACAILILGVAVLLNFLLVPMEDNSRQKGLEVAVDLSDVSAAVAEIESESTSGDNSESTDVFADMTLSRKRARDEAKEVLTGVAESSTAIDSMKEEALGELQKLAEDIECEANIESLIMAKGFENCVAVVNGDTASVIVKTEGLLDSEVAQISEIVYEQAGVHPNNLNIIESDK